MLDSAGTEYTYREYTEDPLSREELDAVFEKLGRSPRELLRGREAKQLGVEPETSDAALLDLMAEHPTLLQRPIFIAGDRAVLGRPVENLEDLV